MAASARSDPIEAIVIGASAGGVDALMTLLRDLKADWRLPIVVVLHVAEGRESLLAEVFGRRLCVPVREAVDKAPIVPGTLYFAPTGYHLLVEQDRTFALSCDPPVYFSRPAIDVLMESAADAYGARLAGFLLTGANEDGAAGMAAIRQRGGLTVVQEPSEAAVPTMPAAAIALQRPDHVLPLADIRALLSNLDLDPCLQNPSSC